MASKQDTIRMGYVYKKVKDHMVLTFNRKQARHYQNALCV